VPRQGLELPPETPTNTAFFKEGSAQDSALENSQHLEGLAVMLAKLTAGERAKLAGMLNGEGDRDATT